MLYLRWPSFTHCLLYYCLGRHPPQICVIGEVLVVSIVCLAGSQWKDRSFCCCEAQSSSMLYLLWNCSTTRSSGVSLENIARRYPLKKKVPLSFTFLYFSFASILYLLFQGSIYIDRCATTISTIFRWRGRFCFLQIFDIDLCKKSVEKSNGTVLMLEISRV